MRVQRLSLTNFRGYVQTEIEFREGVNLIAGINGAGKSSLLDALRILLSRALRDITLCRATPMPFRSSDVRYKTASTDLSVTFQISDETYSYFLHFNRQTFVAGEDGNVREQTNPTPNRAVFAQKGRVWQELNTVPFALFFSPNRSTVQLGRRKSEATSGANVVYSEALADRNTRLQPIIDWWVVHEHSDAVTPIHPKSKRTTALENALGAFLPEFGGITVGNEETGDRISPATLWITKGRIELDIQHLSDGERGMFALVLEIARRLALAYPEMENPIQDGEAVILIDEIELHLHPKWQQEVVQRLERTFPSCQFIITTHSPLVIRQVKADRVIILEEDGKIREPISTFGLSAGEILESVQEVPPLHQEILNALMEALDEFEMERAEALLEQLRSETETPNQLVSEMETLIGNTRALLEDAANESSVEEAGDA